MFNGKMKAVTFSYDDGTTQDIRLVELFNKYNLKATFNISSEFFGRIHSLNRNGKDINHSAIKAEDVKYVYDGHEIAAHTLTHKFLPDIEDDEEIIRQIEQDRLNLSELSGYEVKGLAYPGGGENCNQHIADLVKNNTGIKYARTIGVTKSFDPYPDLYRYVGSWTPCKDWDTLYEMGKEFISLTTDTPKIFYIWGHSYEFDIFPERWELFEEFLKLISNHNDIFYGTNMEILCNT